LLLVFMSWFCIFGVDWKVPSDFRAASLIAGMHGTKLRIMKRRTISPPDSTATVFAGYGFIALRRAACIFITGPLARAGVSLARSGFRLREFRSGVKGPHLTLRSLTNRLILLVRPFGSATCRWFAPAAGCIHASDPLHSCQSVLPAARPISTPLQEFSLLPDQSVRLATRPSGPPSRSARSPFAPRSLSISSWATDQSSRSATFPEACCSSKSSVQLSNTDNITI
jgi:hypothetical protein